MSFLYIFVIVQSICYAQLSSATYVKATGPDAFGLSTSSASHDFVVAEPENDPEGYSDDTVFRSKRETSPPRKAIQTAKQNSTITHISNTTMMEILSNFSRQAVSNDRTFTITKPSASKLSDQAIRRELLPADKVEVVRVTRSTFDATKPTDMSLHMGDLESLIKEEESGDLMPAAGYNSKKYVLVKKKPKHKKIKMEVFEPKMKYKKIKMKVPVKTMKKKKIKGYLVKKEKHHYH